MSEVVEVRCPLDFRRLFMKIRVERQSVPVTAENWMEIACPDCVRIYRKDSECMGVAGPSMVLHYFSILCELMKTEVRP